jgi:hypothetical protein
MTEKTESIEKFKKQAWAAMDSYHKHLDLLQDLHFLCGTRPEAREQAQKLAAELLAFPKELTSRFKDKRKPDEFYERFRPFAEGKSSGAGDPKYLHLFCKDAG